MANTNTSDKAKKLKALVGFTKGPSNKRISQEEHAAKWEAERNARLGFNPKEGPPPDEDSAALKLAKESFNRRMSSGGKPTPLRYSTAMKDALDAGDVDAYRAAEKAAMLGAPLPKKSGGSDAEKLAEKHLGSEFKSLAVKNSDAHDFKDASLESIHSMLHEAGGGNLSQNEVKQIASKHLGVDYEAQQAKGGSAADFHNTFKGSIEDAIKAAKEQGYKGSPEQAAARLGKGKSPKEAARAEAEYQGRTSEQKAIMRSGPAEKAFNEKTDRLTGEHTHYMAVSQYGRTPEERAEGAREAERLKKEISAHLEGGRKSEGDAPRGSGSADEKALDKAERLTSKAEELSERAERTGKMEHHEAAHEAHMDAVMAHMAAGNYDQADEHEAEADTHKRAARDMGGGEDEDESGDASGDDNPPHMTEHEKKTLADSAAELKAAKDPVERAAIKAEHAELKQMVKDRVDGAKAALAGLKRAKEKKESGTVETGAKGGKFVRLPGGGKRYIK